MRGEGGKSCSGSHGEVRLHPQHRMGTEAPTAERSGEAKGTGPQEVSMGKGPTTLGISSTFRRLSWGPALQFI